MLLNILPIRQDNGAQIPFAYTLDLSGLELYGEFPFRTPVRVCGTAQNRADVYWLHCSVSYTYSTRCARCLIPLELEEVLEIDRPMADSVADADSAQADEILLTEQDCIALDDVVTEAILFNTDRSYLCREDCLGLCPQCGADLNLAPCGCKPDTDDRFSVLQDYITGEE